MRESEKRVAAYMRVFEGIASYERARGMRIEGLAVNQEK